VLGYALRRTERSEDAADALSEVMLVAWRRLDDVPNGDEAKLWLYGVAQRVIANQDRSARRRARLGHRLRQEVARQSFDEHGPLDQTQEVRAALRRLSAADREVLLLSAWEDLTPSEIAVVLAQTPAAVRTRLHRARTRLREELQLNDERRRKEKS